MQRIKRLCGERYFAVRWIALASVLLVAPASASAEDPANPRVVAFLDQMCEARAELQQYVVHCIIKSSDLPEFPEGLKITYHASAPEEFFLVVADYSACKQVHASKSKWVGVSANHTFVGKPQGDSHLARRNVKHNPLRSVAHFDVKSLGFGFKFELTNGTKIDQLRDNYSRYSMLELSDKENIALLYSSSSGQPRIVLDKEHGIWPTSSHLALARWKMKLDPDQHVPVWFEFTELDSLRQPQGQLVMTLEWESINEPVPVGREAALALAEQYDSKFTDLTQK